MASCSTAGEDARALASKAPLVAEVVPEIWQSLQVKYGSQNVNVNVTGTTPEYLAVNIYEVEHGEAFTDGDRQSRKRVAVLGSAIPDMFSANGAASRLNKDTLDDRLLEPAVKQEPVKWVIAGDRLIMVSEVDRLAHGFFAVDPGGDGRHALAADVVHEGDQVIDIVRIPLNIAVARNKYVEIQRLDGTKCVSPFAGIGTKPVGRRTYNDVTRGNDFFVRQP